MPTPTYIQLNTITLAQSTASVTLDNIPQSYRDLVLVIGGSASTSTNIQIRFNNDSNNNYSYVAMYTNGSSISRFDEANISSITQLALTTSSSETITQIMDYSAIDKHKTLLIRMGSGAAFVQNTTGRWASVSGITSMTLSPTTGGTNFNTGTTFSIFGIAA
jgi:hypothetical protein